MESVIRGFSLLFLALLQIVSTSISSAVPAENPDEAFYIEPMELRLDPRDREKSAELKVVNKEAFDMRIRIDAFERRESHDGAEERDLTKDLRIDEKEFVLKAGQTKNVRIRYVGLKRLTKERAYRVVVKQAEATAGQNVQRSLDLRFIYVASVYVTPAKAAPRLIVKEVRRTSDRGLEIEFHNEGTAHQRMDVFTAHIEVPKENGTSGEVREVKLSRESRELLAKQNFLPGVQRKILLEIDANEKLTSGGPLNVKLVRTNTTRR